MPGWRTATSRTRFRSKEGFGKTRCTWHYMSAGYAAVWATENTRKPGANGKLPPVGDTVDVAKATWTNTIGATELATVWKDPDFKPSQRAFYYARIIEIPTPRWTAYDQLRFGVKMSKDVPMKHQERAWTSPIWYSPRS